MAQRASATLCATSTVGLHQPSRFSAPDSSRREGDAGAGVSSRCWTKTQNCVPGLHSTRERVENAAWLCGRVFNSLPTREGNATVRRTRKTLTAPPPVYPPDPPYSAYLPGPSAHSIYPLPPTFSIPGPPPILYLRSLHILHPRSHLFSSNTHG